jgi:hypothetical protein
LWAVRCAPPPPPHFFSTHLGRGFGLAVRAECFGTPANQVRILGRDGLYTFGYIPQRFESASSIYPLWHSPHTFLRAWVRWRGRLGGGGRVIWEVLCFLQLRNEKQIFILTGYTDDESVFLFLFPPPLPPSTPHKKPVPNTTDQCHFLQFISIIDTYRLLLQKGRSIWIKAIQPEAATNWLLHFDFVKLWYGPHIHNKQKPITDCVERLLQQATVNSLSAILTRKICHHLATNWICMEF